MIANRVIAAGNRLLRSAPLNAVTNQILRANNQPAIFLQSKRHAVKGVRRPFRSHLERYKLNLSKLPRLTQDLVIGDHHQAPSPPEKLENLPMSLDELWSRKLETYKAFLPVNQEPVLLEALFNPQNDIDKVLRIIDDNLETMTSFYVAVAFETLDDMMRLKRCDINTVIVSPELKRLCTRALMKVRFFEADEVLKLLKCLATIRLPEETMLVQAALQMARHLINDFNLDELKTLSVCLNSFTISDNSDKSLLLALKRAIPAAMRNQIKEKQYEQLEGAESRISRNNEV